MSSPALKQESTPANDAVHASAAEASKNEQPCEQGSKPASNSDGVDNPVKRAVEEFRGLINEMDDLRELLRAHGIPLRTTRMIVEFGVQNKPDKQAMALESAMEQAELSFGKGVLEREVLESHIATIVNLERDLVHARGVARDEGLDEKALSILTQMVQQNPGDGGAKAVNTFLAYALAFGIQTDQLSDVVEKLANRPKSVLPQVPRRVHSAHVYSRTNLLQDMALGLVIGVAIISLLI